MDLLPCPGCGRKGDALKRLQGDATGHGHFVECICGWAGPMKLSPDEAADWWNRRVAPGGK